MTFQESTCPRASRPCRPATPRFDAGSLQRRRRSAHAVVDLDRGDAPGLAAPVQGVSAGLVEHQIAGQLVPRCGSSGRRPGCRLAGRCFARFVVALALRDRPLVIPRLPPLHHPPHRAGAPRTSPTATHRNPTLRHPRDASAWAWRSAPASLRAAGPGALCRVSPRHRAVAGPTCRPSDRGRTAAARARPGHLRATCRARHTTICRTTSRQPARFKANKAFGRAIDG